MKLIALRCPRCSQPLSPASEDIIIACPRCQSAVQLDRRGVVAADLLYAAPAPGTEVGHWLPLWVFYGRVNLAQRAVQEGRSHGDEARAFWQEPRRFYVPAWQISLRTAREVGGQLLREQPRFQPQAEAAEAPLAPTRLTAEDAAKLIEFIVLDLEVRRDDWLRHIAFAVEVAAPALWAIPAKRAGEGWRLLPLAPAAG